MAIDFKNDAQSHVEYFNLSGSDAYLSERWLRKFAAKVLEDASSTGKDASDQRKAELQ